ncbi:cytochrome P450 2F5 isoform X6 [Oryctolagus cuniculus]|uniref:cytochrome P450 2F5 isoform X6 n=1 Tax=Oryctolagus cuniculus TaxID=9986 RepID=UPI00387907A2
MVGLRYAPRSDAGAPTSGAHTSPTAGKLAAAGVWAPGPCTHGGILFSNGQRWRTLRNFTLGALKEFGVGTRTIEERVLEEAVCLLDEFQATAGAPLNPRQLLDNAVANVICSVVFGHRYGYTDPEFRRLLDLFHDNFRIMSSRWGEVILGSASAQIYNIFPSLLDWIPGPHHRIFGNFTELRVFISEQIQRHRQTRQPEVARDFIDCFLAQMDKVQEQQDPESHFQRETLVMTTHNLFFGGTETTSTTLRYGLLILVKYPEVAAKVQAELDAVVGRAHAPRLEDRARLPYTNAVLHEIQRFISVLPLGLPRALTRDAHLHGHFLPKGTFVIPLLASSHRDPTQFKDPDCFNPTNFLDDKGEFQSNDAFMPFALGKRMCLGAGLARSEIFLFLTAILQRFHLLPVGSPANIDLTPQCTGLGNVPPVFQLRLVARGGLSPATHTQ